MDSPFDFLWKMNRQGRALVAEVPGYSSAKENAVSAPDNTWANYLKGTSTEQRFVPSLGLLHYFSENGNNENPWNKEKNNKNPVDKDNYWHWNVTFEAGTDCIGFVQRSMGWSDTNDTPNFYQWKKLPKGILETGTKDYYAVLGQYHNTRAYPRPSDSVATNILSGKSATATTINKVTTWTKTNDPQPSIEDLRKVALGDIFVKQSNTSNQDDFNAHIAIVMSLPNDDMITDSLIFMNKMVLIEAEFNSKIQSVIKQLTVGDYNNNEVLVGTKFYGGFIVEDQSSQLGNQGLLLNCQSWAIRRLK
jgi:hypothetical protein